MIRLPSRLRLLDDALADPAFEDDAMLLCELDGYLAGLAVCPVPIWRTKVESTLIVSKGKRCR